MKNKVLERCPKDVKKLINPLTGRCVLESNPTIKKLLKKGFTIVVTPYVDQPEPPKKMSDVKVFKICPSDPNKLVNPLTGRCVIQNNPTVKKLLKDGWVISLKDPNPAPVIIKPDKDIDYKKLKDELDKDRDGIVSINEFLGSREITLTEEQENKGVFPFLHTGSNIPKFLTIMKKTNPIIGKNLCWFKPYYYVNYKEVNGKKTSIKISKSRVTIDTKKYPNYYLDNSAVLHGTPLNIGNNLEETKFIVTPDLKNEVLNCKERYFAMALSLQSTSIHAEVQEGGHSNVIFFDTAKKTIDRFDPHGTKSFGGNTAAYDQNAIDRILKKEFKKILPQYEFIDFEMTCPYFGAQLKVESGGVSRADGYCVTWSLMFIILRILNPDKSVLELAKKMSEGTREEMIKKIRKFAKYYSDVLKNAKYSDLLY